MGTKWSRWVLSAVVLGAGFFPACAGDGDDAAAGGGTEEEVCGTASFGPRQLRLLTRREYEATVRDLFGDTVDWGADATATACSADADCAIATESCVASACQTDPCTLHTFVFPANGATHASVHVAGTFNGWPGTIAAGGWPMTYVPSLDAWVAKHVVDDGAHAYKLVIDETTWIADPENPDTEADGFGGYNSRLTMACAGEPPPPTPEAKPFDVTAGFPVESRPTGFPFDNAAEAGLVTATHVERYLRAAEALVTRADLHELSGCDLDAEDDACVREFLATFGERTFRRPLEQEETDKYAALAAAQTERRLGVEVALRVMLSSPMFLYRQEIGVVGEGGVARLDGWELAAALSYFYWGTTPDAALLEAARDGRLDTPEGVQAEARRLVSDDRARSRIEIFAAQWLGIEGVVDADKSLAAFPEFDDALAAAMLAETQAFVSSVVFDEAGTYQDLLLGSTTTATGALAALYGANGGALPAERHAGVLAHASVLASYSHSDQTSPIRRGVFVRERILCEHLPPPPPDAATIPEIEEGASTRERFSQHSADPACSACHRLIDPVGFAFEHFDAIGRYRETENGSPIDASGDVARLGGENPTHDGLLDLAALLAYSQEAPACLAQNAYRFAIGALETEAQACDLQKLASYFADHDFEIKELLVFVTQLESFRMRRQP